MYEFDILSVAYYLLDNQPMDKKKLHLTLHYINCLNYVLHGFCVINPKSFSIIGYPISLWLNNSFTHVADDEMMFVETLTEKFNDPIQEPPAQLKDIMDSLLEFFEDMDGDLMELYWFIDGSPRCWIKSDMYKAHQICYCHNGRNHYYIKFGA